MKRFHFAKTYFKKQIFEKNSCGVRVVVTEKPSINLREEEYSLRITTRYEDYETVHRNYAIEHHLPPAKHSFPPLQFKFHTEEIGQFRVRIDIKNDKEYEKAILGFIYKVKKMLQDLEEYCDGITSEVLVVPLVNKLKEEGNFLAEKITKGIEKYSVEFDSKRGTRDKVGRLKNNPLLLDFIGSKNLKKIKEIRKLIKKK